MPDHPAPVWVAFLRAMNVGGRRLGNGDLVAATEGCGCRDVWAYQASGNVVLVDERSEPELQAALEGGLASTLGYPVRVFLRSVGEVRAAAGATPFSAEELAASAGKPQVVLLQGAPTAPVLRQLVALVPGDDRLVPAGRALHWLPATGLADSGLDLRRLDAVTGGATVRTQGTLQRLASKLG